MAAGLKVAPSKKKRKAAGAGAAAKKTAPPTRACARTVGGGVCGQPFDPPAPHGAGAPGDSSTHCPACVLSVLEGVHEGIASGDVGAFETLARACPGLVVDARLSDVVLRFVIAARLLQSEGGGAGRGNHGGGGGSGKGSSKGKGKGKGSGKAKGKGGSSRSSGAVGDGKEAACYASSKEVEDEVECWYNDDRGGATIEWDGVLQHMLYSNPLHIAAFVTASADAGGNPSDKKDALYAINKILVDLDLAETLLRGEASGEGGGGKGGSSKARKEPPPAHLNARWETPLAVASGVDGVPAAVLDLLGGSVEEGGEGKDDGKAGGEGQGGMGTTREPPRKKRSSKK